MDKRIKIIAVVILLPIAVVVPMLLAQTIAMDSRVYAQQTTLQQRVEEYKTKLGTAPSQNDLNKLKLRCSVAQTVFKNLQTRVDGVNTKRTEVYTNIGTSITELQTALKAATVDTTKLEGQMKELDTKVAQFKTDMTAYKQAVDDSAAIDCAADPLALKGSLQEARNTHDKLVTEVADIRTYITNAIKPTLTQIRADVQERASAAATTPTTPAVTTEGTPNAAQ